MPARKTEDEYRFLAERRRFEWLGPFPRNTKASTVWRCVNGHAFHACYNNVDQEMNCTFCAREQGSRAPAHSSRLSCACRASRDILVRTAGNLGAGPDRLGVRVRAIAGPRGTTQYNKVRVAGSAAMNGGRPGSDDSRRNTIILRRVEGSYGWDRSSPRAKQKRNGNAKTGTAGSRHLIGFNNERRDVADAPVLRR